MSKLMVSDDVRQMALDLKKETGESTMNCRRALMFNEMNVEKARAYLKLYTWDSHGFKTNRGAHLNGGKIYTHT